MTRKILHIRVDVDEYGTEPTSAELKLIRAKFKRAVESYNDEELVITSSRVHVEVIDLD